VGVVVAGCEYRTGSAIEAAQQSETQRESADAVKIEFPHYPRERSARFIGSVRLGFFQPLREISRGGIRPVELLFLFEKSRPIQTLRYALHHGRHASALHSSRALLPQPADLAAQAERGLAKPVVRQPVRRFQTGCEHDG